MAKHEEYLWRDPFDAVSSGPVLLSDQIHFLAEEVDLVDPFEPKALRPASYDVHVGDVYYVDDLRKELDSESSEIEIPPNGLVYVKTKEKFNVPYYVVARYSLRVGQVYRGLLIDNGLHIDPGYSGHIWIPVHNFTMQPRVLMRAEEFISVEFNRTTRLPRDVHAIRSQDELVSYGLNSKLKGAGGHAIKIFYKDLERYKSRHDDFTPRLFWDKFPGERHTSGTLATDQRMDKLDQRMDKLKQDVGITLEKRIESLRSFGIVASIAAFTGLIVAIFGILLPILYAEFGKNREAVIQNASEIGQLRQLVQEQKERLDTLARPQAGAAPATGGTAGRGQTK
jgi:deoxycytidine triphosphate deaminase